MKADVGPDRVSPLSTAIAYSSIIAARATGEMNSIVRSRHCISDFRATFSVSFGLSICFTKAGAWLGAMDDRAKSLSRA